MTVFLCVSDGDGLRFFGKRVSRDREIISDILKDAGGKVSILSESAVLFESGAEVCDSLPGGEYSFTERNIDFSLFSKIVIYRFNRKYPFDEALSIDLSGYKKVSETEFPGYSHEKITKEVWAR